jgi:uncharacterized glyoxalase superfamily protein PhnB
MTATIQPVLHYADLAKGVAYLTETFGFAEHVIHRTPEGEPVYAELFLDGCYLGVGATSSEASPFDLGPTVLYVAIDDPDSMHERVVGAGTEIVMGLTDQEYGSREFAAETMRATCGASVPTAPGPSRSRASVLAMT